MSTALRSSNCCLLGIGEGCPYPVLQGQLETYHATGDDAEGIGRSGGPDAEFHLSAGEEFDQSFPRFAFEIERKIEYPTHLLPYEWREWPTPKDGDQTEREAGYSPSGVEELRSKTSTSCFRCAEPKNGTLSLNDERRH